MEVLEAREDSIVGDLLAINLVLTNLDGSR